MKNKDIKRHLTNAIRKGRVNKVKNIIESYGISYFPEWEEGFNLLCDALTHKQSNVAKLLLNSGCKVSVEEGLEGEVEVEELPLNLAVENGDTEIIKMILDKNFNVNVGGCTPLYCAIRAKNLDVIKLFLQHGECVNALVNGGHSPLYTAVVSRSVQIVEYLLNQNLSIDSLSYSADCELFAPLHEAVQQNNGKYSIYF